MFCNYFAKGGTSLPRGGRAWLLREHNSSGVVTEETRYVAQLEANLEVSDACPVFGSVQLTPCTSLQPLPCCVRDVLHAIDGGGLANNGKSDDHDQ